MWRCLPSIMDKAMELGYGAFYICHSTVLLKHTGFVSMFSINIIFSEMRMDKFLYTQTVKFYQRTLNLIFTSLYSVSWFGMMTGKDCLLEKPSSHLLSEFLWHITLLAKLSVLFPATHILSSNSIMSIFNCGQWSPCLLCFFKSI